MRRTVNDRIAVELSRFDLPCPSMDALRILGQFGFRRIDVDLVRLAKSRVGVSSYRRGALPREAPGTVDCSSLVKWLLGEAGVWLPRRTIQQIRFGDRVASDDFHAGDLIYTTGLRNRYDDDPSLAVGHVGMATGTGTVIHASGSERGVVEDPLERFLGKNRYRCARRHLTSETIILECPPEFDVECDDDLRWIILQRL